MLKLLGPDGKAVASSDTGTSPEAVNYSNDGAKIADGAHQVLVCKFADPNRDRADLLDVEDVEHDGLERGPHAL